MEFQGKKKSYEEAKLDAIVSVLFTVGIEVVEEFGTITIKKDGQKIATVDISTPLRL